MYGHLLSATVRERVETSRVPGPQSELGRLLEQRRDELGLTTTEAARVAGISRETLQRIRKGPRQVRAETLDALERLGIPRDQIEQAAAADAGYASPRSMPVQVQRIALKLTRLDEYDLDEVERRVDHLLRLR